MIVGGESGIGARPLKEEWLFRIQEQCRAAAVPFFFKQWGGVWKSEAGRQLGGRTYDQMPERKSSRVPLHRIRLDMIEEVRNWEAAYDLPDMTAIPAGDVDCQPLLF